MGGVSINPAAASDLLRDPETFMLPVFVIIGATYGMDTFEMDPLEIYARLKEDFNADVPLQIENRINAGLTCIPNDSFYTDIRVFKAVCNSLYTGDLGDDLILDPVTLPEILWAVYEMELLRGVEDEPEFTPTIQAFIRSVAAQEAVTIEDQEDMEALRNSFIEESIEDLARQLRLLGIDEEDIQKMHETTY